MKLSWTMGTGRSICVGVSGGENMDISEREKTSKRKSLVPFPYYNIFTTALHIRNKVLFNDNIWITANRISTDHLQTFNAYHESSIRGSAEITSVVFLRPRSSCVWGGMTFSARLKDWREWTSWSGSTSETGLAGSCNKVEMSTIRALTCGIMSSSCYHVKKNMIIDDYLHPYSLLIR